MSEPTSLPTRTRSVSWADPQILVNHADAMTGIEFLSAIRDGQLPPPPIFTLMDLTIADIAEGKVIIQTVPAEFHYNTIGVVHGGLAATLLDTAMACAIHATLASHVAYTTLELHVNYVRPMTEATGPVQGIGEVLHRGSRVATAAGRIVDAMGKLYAHATTTCMIFRG